MAIKPLNDRVWALTLMWIFTSLWIMYGDGQRLPVIKSFPEWRSLMGHIWIAIQYSSRSVYYRGYIIFQHLCTKFELAKKNHTVHFHFALHAIHHQWPDYSDCTYSKIVSARCIKLIYCPCPKFYGIVVTCRYATPWAFAHVIHMVLPFGQSAPIWNRSKYYDIF